MLVNATKHVIKVLEKRFFEIHHIVLGEDAPENFSETYFEVQISVLGHVLILRIISISSFSYGSLACNKILFLRSEPYA